MKKPSLFLLALIVVIPIMGNTTVVFLHIPKTGGTTISSLLKENFKEEEIYPFPKIGRGGYSTKDRKKLEEILKEFPPIEHKLIWGHFPLWFLKKKDPEYDTNSYYFTVLRDPVQRILSRDRDDLREKRISQSNPLRTPANVMCRMLSFDPTLEGEELLKSAISGLNKMNYIIFIDDFDTGVNEVFRKLNLFISKVPQLNSTSHINQVISNDVIEKIKEKHSLDIRLYEYARHNFFKGDVHNTCKK